MVDLYKVKQCRAENLENTLNEMSEKEYEIEKYEHIDFDISTGFEWVVIRKKEVTKVEFEKEFHMYSKN